MEGNSLQGRWTRILPRATIAIVLTCLISVSLPSSAHTRGGGYEGTGRYIVAVAKSYQGTPYGTGPGQMLCSDLTRQAVGRGTGVWMPAWDDKQTRYGWQSKRLKRGDLVWFREHGGAGRATHTGIYAGNGKLVHSSIYFNRVVKSEMRYINGLQGWRRIR